MASTSSGSFEASRGSTPPSTVSSSPSGSQTAAVAEKPPDESSKLRMFLGVLRKFIGVADLASVRFSLPTQLLEPTPNLEYWNYLDQPSAFVAIGQSEEPLDRMLEVLRFWLTKDLKYVKGKPCKPYNSTLGEFFRCNYEVDELLPPIDTSSSQPGSSASSTRSLATSLSSKKTTTVLPPAAIKSDHPIRLSYLTEQTSHHPPVSAWVAECAEQGITARGFDQLSAKFTGTSIKVGPGEHNLGIFVTLHKRGDEQYQLTHPAAHLGGLLRGSLSISVGDQCYMTCSQTKLKIILHYVEEGWLGKTQNKVEGVIFRYDPDNDDKSRIRDVPEEDILARITGNWKEKVYFSLAPRFETQRLIMDLGPLTVAPKILPPTQTQLPNESLRFWSAVTEAILGKQYSRATALKQEIEERQRVKARQREEAGTQWQPRFFEGAVTPVGKPVLTSDGRETMQNLQDVMWDIKESKVTAS